MRNWSEGETTLGARFTMLHVPPHAHIITQPYTQTGLYRVSMHFIVIALTNGCLRTNIVLCA